MGCGACAAAAAKNNQSYSLRKRQVVEVNIDCDYTKEIITNWLNALKCIKLNNKESQIGIDAYTRNRYLGILQSALNYPDNYCYFFTDLEAFKIDILPQIISNVPDCI